MNPSRPIPVLKRRARLLAREEGIPLHAALDQIARQQGFRSWSHLSARTSPTTAGPKLFSGLERGDFVLLAARPRQGKTVLSLKLLLEAVRSGHAAVFFTLEFTRDEVLSHLGAAESDLPALAEHLLIDVSDEISAEYIRRRLSDARPGTFVVIDYLQLLDQPRRNPEVGEQAASLRDFTRERGLITVCLSQIDRRFELSRRKVPSFDDVRLPNPLDLGLFTRAWFLHAERLSEGTLR